MAAEGADILELRLLTMRSLIVSGVFWFLVFAVGLSCATGQEGPIFLNDGVRTRRITENGRDPSVSGSKVVWVEFDGHDYELFTWDGAARRQFTDNELHDGAPEVSGDRIIWLVQDGRDSEVMLYDGAMTNQLTDNATNEYLPRISATHAAWLEGSPFSFDSVVYYDGANMTVLGHPNTPDATLDIDGARVAWVEKPRPESPEEIFYYDGRGVIRLTDDDVRDVSPHLADGFIAWQRGPLNRTDIFAHDGTTSRNLTSNGDSVNNYDLVSDGQRVTWTASPTGPGGFSLSDIFVYEGESVTLLTHNSFPDTMPQISGENLAWLGYPHGAESEVFFYDGERGIVRQLTFTPLHPERDVRISGSNVVWVGVIPEPSTRHFAAMGCILFGLTCCRPSAALWRR